VGGASGGAGGSQAGSAGGTTGGAAAGGAAGSSAGGAGSDAGTSAGGVGGASGGAGGSQAGSAGGSAPTDGGPDGGLPSALPDCLKNLIAACPTEGECTQTAVDGGSEAVFASGVHATFTTQPMPQGLSYCFGTSTVVTVRRPDGSDCYSLESYAYTSTACEYTNLIWRDASGATVATGSTGGGSGAALVTSIACTGGAPANCPASDTSRCCTLNRFGAPGCGSAPACPVGNFP
jgi:hypothetical protein